MLEIDDDGFEQLCRPFKAPMDYVRRLNSELQAVIVNYHLSNDDESVRPPDSNTIVVSRNGKFRGFDRGDLHRLLATDMLHAVRGGLQDNSEDLENQALNLHASALQIDIILPPLTDIVRVGDIIRYGLRVRHPSRKLQNILTNRSALCSELRANALSFFSLYQAVVTSSIQKNYSPENSLRSRCSYRMALA